MASRIAARGQGGTSASPTIDSSADRPPLGDWGAARVPPERANGVEASHRRERGPKTRARPRTDSARSVGDRAVDLDLSRSLGQSFALAALAVRGQMRSLAVHIERRVILVLLIEDEQVRILRRAM